MVHYKIIARELSISERQVESTVELLDGGATVPFISRYRKEVTGELDEVQIAAIRDRIEQLRELDKRKDSVLKSITEQGKLTPELEKQVKDAKTMAELEDIYLPYKPKRRTRATIAKEKGLEPLANLIFEQSKLDIYKEAESYISEEKQVASIEEALVGARDIIAEKINEDKDARTKIRKLFMDTALISSKVLSGKETEAIKYKDYFDWKEAINKIPSHRLLALRRGEKEGFLMLDIQPEAEVAIEILEKQFVLNRTESAEQVKLATQDAYKRLMSPSIETDIRMKTKDTADEDAIKVFTENLKQLLLASPLGQKNVLSIDPGFRSGCKVVVLDKQGKLLHNDVVYPEMGSGKKVLAEQTILALCAKHNIEAIAIGNGTAGRETEDFIRKLGLPAEIMIVMVNESGASVYSASDVAREEFPDYDLTVRGAVSIGRRLMDPLAELVKIDPKAIGVGQYQHDVEQNKLKTSLDDVVISCVNAVGVEVNTASKQLLTYVSGLGPQLAENIIKHRNENGPFKKREELKKVARMGDKAFEQCAGFLRIRDAINPLDSSSVHPESYQIVEKMAKDQNCSIEELIKNDAVRKAIDLKKYVSETVGLPTLQDIVKELAKPGRDPREKFETFSFTDGVNKIEDLRVGMKLPGIVTNVTNFGAFVDIGVHQDGLVHVSQLSDTFISDPKTIVKVQQKVMVTVTEVDAARKRIALTMKNQDKSQTSSKPQMQTPKKKEPEIQGSLQDQLAALKNKFR
ncbi:MAG: RNA-binding transcriptional accessory protein [Bacteroidetes bacterium]|nr:MAG: RNA-binding transcriptional accessory protein [Bacteroidota bacterium]